MDNDVLILGIESSCDETAASVVRNGREVLSNTIYSQIDLHTLYGGVVPEIASRKHIEKINRVIKKSLEEANVSLNDIDAIVEELQGHFPIFINSGCENNNFIILRNCLKVFLHTRK